VSFGIGKKSIAFPSMLPEDLLTSNQLEARNLWLAANFYPPIVNCYEKAYHPFILPGGDQYPGTEGYSKKDTNAVH
jgi:hypothetical protein